MSERSWIGGFMKTGLVSLFAIVAFLAFAVSSASAAEPPTVTIDPNPTAGYTTAEVSGEVDPKGEEVNVYAEYRMAGTDGAWGEYFVQTIAAGVGPNVIGAEITGLDPNTKYEFRLDAEVSGLGEFFSPEPNPSFTTKAVASPTVSIKPVSGVTGTTATLTGHVAPNGPGPAPQDPAFNTTWVFECTGTATNAIEQRPLPASNSLASPHPYNPPRYRSPGREGSRNHLRLGARCSWSAIGEELS